MKYLIAATLISSGLVATIAATVLLGETHAVTRVPILLELFTSEGCSSCPPADRVLESLDHQPVPNADLIVLSEHVDYWNHLGWSDPWSSPFFSARQKKYSNQFASTVYTPQLVIDGRFQTVGSDKGEVMQAISQALQQPKLPLSISASRSGPSASIHVDAMTGGTRADLYIAIAADHAQSKVLRGENGGHILTHVAVVKTIVKLGKWEEGAGAVRDYSLPVSTAEAGTTRMIAILEDPRSGRVLGSAQTRF